MAARDMVARHSDFEETKDFIPTPPFATRALYEYVAPNLKIQAPFLSAWDPAAGHGHMTRVMEEYGHIDVLGTDITPWPAADVVGLNFLDDHGDSMKYRDVIVTNPPYKHLEEFMRNGLHCARHSFALLVRVQALEGQGRYERIFNKVPPTQIAFFSDRIPFVSGKVVRKAPKMFFHIWVYWDVGAIRRGDNQPKAPMWIPPNVQELLEKDEDYE